MLAAKLIIMLGILMGASVVLAAYLIDLLTRPSKDSRGVGLW